MREIAILKADYEAAKQLVIHASKQLFKLEQDMSELASKIDSKEVTLFMPHRGADLQPIDSNKKNVKEPHIINIIQDQIKSGHRFIMEFTLDPKSLQGTHLGEWLKDGEEGHLYTRTHSLVMSNGDVYTECFPHEITGDEVMTTVKVTYSEIQ